MSQQLSLIVDNIARGMNYDDAVAAAEQQMRGEDE